MKKLHRILADIAYIALFYCFYRFLPFYQTNLHEMVFVTLGWVAVFFITISVISNLILKKRDAVHVLVALWHFLKAAFQLVRQPSFKNLKLKIEEPEKVKLRSFLVKLFFIPIMLTFFIGNYYDVIKLYEQRTALNSSEFVTLFNQYLFGLIIAVILAIDTFIFLVGYLLESKYLKNEIKSVDASLFGWIVTLACYPPFNELTAQYFNRFGEMNVLIYNEAVTFVVRIVMVLLFGIYLLASINLGFKASNLTNRGIVTKGVYSIIRHPAYVSKNLVWWLASIPMIVMSPGAILAPIAWSFIYFLRAITEERHLMQDPDYQVYCNKVRYRFIPGLY